MYNAFCDILGSENVLKDEPMSRHTTFRIGGNADYFLTPESEEQLIAVLRLLREKEMPYCIVGNGSNLLVGDRGIRGAVVCLYKKMSKIECCGTEIYAECGALLSGVSSAALNAGLTGFEFASGIPGTVGGAVYMNAGAYGCEMKDAVKSVRYIDSDLSVREISAADCKFGYRTGIFTGSDKIILSCRLELRRGSTDEIRAKISELTQKRVSKQPLDKPSAGSTFKRPEGHFAGGLIESAGLKGAAVGGAAVSEKHAGFVVNNGGATARDVTELIEYIKKTVSEKSGVTLEPEIKMIGEF